MHSGPLNKKRDLKCDKGPKVHSQLELKNKRDLPKVVVGVDRKDRALFQILFSPLLWIGFREDQTVSPGGERFGMENIHDSVTWYQQKVSDSQGSRYGV